MSWSPEQGGLDPNSPLGMAAVVLARASAFDSTVPAASAVVTQSWAEMIARSGLSLAELEEGVLRTYAREGEPPRNKLAAILAEARAARRDQRRLRREALEAREQEALPAAGSWTGEPVPEAYAAHGAGQIPCPACGSVPGGVCVDAGRTRKMPHFARIAQAARGA